MIFLISIINAQSLIAGKIYNSDYTALVSGAEVSVTCNSNILNTDSLDDGTYAVKFEENLCGLGDSVSVNAEKSDLSGSGTGIVVECEQGDDCEQGSLFSIINLAIKSQSNNNNNNNNGGDGSYYFCGNNRCDSGETINTCPKDCKITQNQTQPLITNTTSTETTTNTNTNSDSQLLDNNENNNPQSNLSKITGAVTGALGNTGWLIIIIFIIALLILSLVIRIIRKRKNIEEEY